MGWFIRFENVVILMGIYKSGTVKRNLIHRSLVRLGTAWDFFGIRKDKQG